MTQTAVAVWDFTIPREQMILEDIIGLCTEHSKKWCFQLERGEKTGYEHWQGRISLKVKSRVVRFMKAHWSPTSKENRDNMFYAMKEDTRIDGPWSDELESKKIRVPRQVREIQGKLYPWQVKAEELSKEWDPRRVNLVYDEIGNKGKSMWTMHMQVHGHARMLPFVNNFKDLMRMVCDMPESGCYIIDIPRAIKKTELQGLFSGIEMVKNGYAYDDRYHFKDKYFDSPCIWVFVNKLPKSKYLSKDRWRIFKIDEKMELVRYKPVASDYCKKKTREFKAGAESGVPRKEA